MVKPTQLKIFFLIVILIVLLTSCSSFTRFQYIIITSDSNIPEPRIITRGVFIITDPYKGDSFATITVRMYANDTLLENVEASYDASSKEAFFGWSTIQGCTDLPQGNQLFRYEMYNAQGEIVQQASKRAIINNCD